MSANGITVKTEVELDHFNLGMNVAEWCDGEQAMFLLGLSEGFAALGGVGHMQLHYIVAAAEGMGRNADIRRFIELLNEYFKEQRP